MKKYWNAPHGQFIGKLLPLSFGCIEKLIKIIFALTLTELFI